MKRDMELVRRILVELGDSQHELEASLFADGRHDYQDVARHMLMMADAGLITVRKLAADDEWRYVAATGLTWEGNDFLAAAKDEKLWKRVLLDAAKKAGDVPFSVLASMLKAALMAKLGLA